jgi:hypothetical protein
MTKQRFWRQNLWKRPPRKAPDTAMTMATTMVVGSLQLRFLWKRSGLCGA